MSLSKLLEYQTKDLTLYRQEKELADSAEKKRANLCKEKFIECNNTLKQLQTNVVSYYRLLQDLNKKIQVMVENKNNLIADQNKLKTEKDFASFERKLQDFEKKLNDLNKEINRIVKQISDVQSQNKTTNETMDKLNREYMLSMQVVDKKQKEFNIVAKPVIDELSEIKKEIEERYMEKYLQLREMRKMPAFVPYLEKNCGACGMDISIEVDKKLVESGDVAECPHCGRIVYKL